MDTSNRIHHLQEMLKQLNVGDPYLTRWLEQQVECDQRRQEEADASKEVIRRLRIQNKKLLEQVALLKDLLKQHHAAKETDGQRISHLARQAQAMAEAVGACPECWGERQDCPVCHGHGLPGWTTIHKKHFNLFILPCLEKLYGFAKHTPTHT